MKEIVDKLSFIKIKNFCSGKDTARRMKTQSTDWEKIFAKHIKNWYPKYTNDSKLNN